MKILRRCLLLNVFITLAGLGHVLAAQGPFTVTISADAPVVKAGRPVIVNVTVTNTSKREIDASGSVNESLGMDTYNRYDIRDASGNSVDKAANKQAEPVVGGGGMPIMIKPGESKLVSSDVVSTAYDLSRPGRYTIQLSRSASGRSKEEPTIKSNKITVTVTE